jgi:two-component system OmpR family response regulator
MEKQEHISMFIIDGDKMLATALKSDLERTFEDHDLKISLFETGEESTERISENPDVVIVDYSLNSKNSEAMTGVKIIDLIKQKSPGTEVIIFTEEEHADIALKAMHHGVHDYIVKNDYMFRKLNMTVLQCLKLKRLKSEIRTQRVKSNILVVSMALMAGAFIALRLWAPGVLAR